MLIVWTELNNNIITIRLHSTVFPFIKTTRIYIKMLFREEPLPKISRLEGR